MRYVRAQDVFPDDLLQQIQNYVDGEYIYIPRRDDNKKAWGENTQSRLDIAQRNQRIFADYQKGSSADELAMRYFLSEKSIRKILLEQKRRIER